MHTNLFLWFNPLNTQVRTLVIKLLKINIKLYYAEILTVYKPVCLCKLRDAHGMPTFKTEALRIVSNVQLIKELLLQN